MATNFTFTRENAEQMVAKVQAQADAMKTAFEALAAAARLNFFKNTSSRFVYTH